MLWRVDHGARGVRATADGVFTRLRLSVPLFSLTGVSTDTQARELHARLAAEVAREIAFGQPGQSLQVEEVGALARGQRGENCEPRGVMNEPIEVGELLKWC